MAINEDFIIANCQKLPLNGNEDGLIPAFGLYLTRHYADFYNYSTFESLRYLETHKPNTAVEAEAKFRAAGMLCAFYTFGGIMLSQEWEAVVMPQIESQDDWVAGIVAIVNSFGWGKWKIEKLISGELLEISIANSYESEGWLKRYLLSNHPRCYLVQGGCAGIMNLLYHGDIRRRPALNQEYFQQIFYTPGSFRCEEVECRTVGNTQCRFITKRDI